MAITINGTTGLAGVDGSASTPAVQGGDSNTGVFFPAADTVAIATGGSERLRATSGGDVGIGTTSPGAKLGVGGGAGNAKIKLSNTASGSGSGDGFDLDFTGTDIYITNRENGFMAFENNGAERCRITSGGDLLVGTTTASAQFHLSNSGGGGTEVMRITTAGGQTNSFYYPSNGLSGTGPSATSTVQRIWRDATTSRSINAAGTVNASGADYAEYMTKAGDFTLVKGDVVGVNADGLLTNVFVDAVSFVVKSSNPSYVGNDGWGSDLEGDELEAARQKVDRVAFAGQVPVNVLGATPGQYIVPIEDNGGIKGVAKNEGDLTLAEYMKAVGKVIAVEADGRAKIIVKVA